MILIFKRLKPHGIVPFGFRCLNDIEIFKRYWDIETILGYWGS